MELKINPINEIKEISETEKKQIMKDAVNNKGNLYKGPEWFINAANDDIYTGIYR